MRVQCASVRSMHSPQLLNASTKVASNIRQNAARCYVGSDQSTCSVTGAPPSFAYVTFRRKRNRGGGGYNYISIWTAEESEHHDLLLAHW